MSDSPRLSYEVLAALVVSQAAVIESLTARVAEQDGLIAGLNVRIAELERQLGRSSSNSSQPPSQDDRSGPRCRQGGQAGHPGKGLARVAAPDRRQAVEPAACAGCGGDLA